MPWACAASTPVASHDTIGARPGSMRGATFLGEIVGPHDEAGEPRLQIVRRCRDGANIDHRERCFHHGPDADVRIGPHVDNAGGKILQLMRVGYLRYQHCVRAHVGNSVQVVDPPAGIETIDTHKNFAVAEAALLQRFPDLFPRHHLGFGGHRIFKVENDAVGRQFARFFDRARIRSGHVQHATPRADSHSAVPHSPSNKLAALHCSCQLGRVTDGAAHIRAESAQESR